MKDQTQTKPDKERTSVRFLDLLSDDKKEKLALEFKIEKYHRKNVIFYQGDSSCRFYEVLQGQLKLSKYTTDGHEVTVEILRKGDWFGFLPLIDGKVCECTVTTLTDTVLFSVSNRAFAMIIQDEPEVLIKVLKSACDRLRSAYSQVENIFSGSVKSRICRILLEMARQKGKRKNSHLVFQIQLTHQELANLVGTSRETVTRVLTSLKKKELIKVNRSKISILDEGGMEDMIE